MTRDPGSAPSPTPGSRQPPPVVLALLFGLLCLIWSSTWIVIRVGLRDLPPFGSAALRFLAAGALMALVAPPLHRLEGGARPPAWLWLALGTLNFAASYGILYWCETALPGSIACLIWAVFPLLMAGAGTLFLRERLTRVQVVGFLVTVVGTARLFVDDLPALGAEVVPMAALLFLSPLVSCVGTVFVKRYGSGCSSVLLNRNAMLTGGVLLLLVAAVVERGMPVRLSGAAAASLAYLAFAGTFLTFGIYHWLLRWAPASRLSLIAVITPCLALLLDWAAGEVAPTWTLAAGTVLVLAGVLLVVRGRQLFPAGRPGRARGRVLALLLLVAAVFAPALVPEPTVAAHQPRERILAALRIVESGDRAAPPDGDGGAAIGPYQIHYSYWFEARAEDPAIGGDYADCRDRAYAERVVAAYMRRWVPAAWADGDAEVIARVHNGGPGGDREAATLPYWRKVRAVLARLVRQP